MTKTRSTATGEGVSRECRLWGDPPCADAQNRGEMLDTHRRRPVADRRRVHAVLCAGLLLVFMAGRPALAQLGAEIEIGGGYHAAFDLGGDWFTVPSTPTVDARSTAWVSDRWGVAARGLVGLGGVLRGHAGVERRRPTYFQVLAATGPSARAGPVCTSASAAGCWGGPPRTAFTTTACTCSVSRRLPRRP